MRASTLPTMGSLGDGLQAEFMESAMAGSTSFSTPEGEVNSLMQQVADDYSLEVSVGQPQPGAHAVPTKETEKVHEDNLSRRLAELKAKVINTMIDTFSSIFFNHSKQFCDIIESSSEEEDLTI
ncbi:hypothetical protein G4B88_021691 [Cannabis sativa]|nr:hypothetical protein G4B88_021691 [Cannabis sativa]